MDGPNQREQMANQAESDGNQWLKTIFTLHVQDGNQWTFEVAANLLVIQEKREQNVPRPNNSEAGYHLEDHNLLIFGHWRNNGGGGGKSILPKSAKK